MGFRVEGGTLGENCPMVRNRGCAAHVPVEVASVPVMVN